jgi:hypothetical protein
MTRCRRSAAMRLAVSLTIVCALGVTTAGAQGAAGNACAPKKVQAGGEYLADLLACEILGAVRIPGVIAQCGRVAERRFERAFAAIERGGTCATSGDGPSVAASIEAAEARLVGLLGTRPRACELLVLPVMREGVERHTICAARAAASGAGGSLDPACEAAATGAFLEKIARLDRIRACGQAIPNGQLLDDRIREAVAGLRGAIVPPVSTCAPIEVTAFHGRNFLGNSRLARIENGHVPCLQVDDATPATCAFSTQPGAQSGEWLESPQGAFAKVGQAVRLDGTPGGDYIVAARVSDASPAECVEAAGMDTAGWVDPGTTLARSCTLEEAGQQWNQPAPMEIYTPLLNFADMEVCSPQDPHPDNAELTRSYASSGSGPPDRFCYTGRGAALNDLNGDERDALGMYYSYYSLPGRTFCHMIINAGFEVPGAKRPATFTLPFPGGIRTSSLITWKPVNPNMVIANGGGDGAVETFDDQAAFVAATDAFPASGPLPDLGVVSSARIGSVTVSLATGGNSLAVGTAGTGVGSAWYPAMPGNQIALGYEALQVQTAAPVFSIGFDFVEPNATIPAYGGFPVDSTFDVVLYDGSREVGRTSFNAPDDQVTFIGVWSERAFDRVTIVDRTGNDDDEYFGQFYTGTRARP